MDTQELTAELAKIVALLGGPGREKEKFEAARRAREIIADNVDTARIFAQLLEHPRNRRAMRWYAWHYMAEFGRYSSPEVVLVILTSMLRTRDEDVMAFAIDGVRLALDCSSRWYVDSFSLDSPVWKEFVAVWSPDVPHQYVGGRIFSALGAGKDAARYFESIEADHIVAALEFGMGAGLREQVRRILPRALDGDSEERFVALNAILELGLGLDYLESVLRLSRHPDPLVREYAVRVLVTVADKDESGKARKSIARFLNESPTWSIARDYIVLNREADEDIVAGLLKSLEKIPYEEEKVFLDYMARWAMENPHIAEMILQYHHSGRGGGRCRELVRRMIQFGVNGIVGNDNIPARW